MIAICPASTNPEYPSHRWRLDEPDGRPRVKAVCACGATKDQPSSMEDFAFRVAGEMWWGQYKTKDFAS